MSFITFYYNNTSDNWLLSHNDVVSHHCDLCRNYDLIQHYFSLFSGHGLAYIPESIWLGEKLYALGAKWVINMFGLWKRDNVLPKCSSTLSHIDRQSLWWDTNANIGWMLLLFFFCGCWWDVCMITMLTLLLHLFDFLCVFFSPSVRLYQVPWPITSSQTLCCALTPLTTPITPYWANQPSITTPPSACTTLKVCCILPLLWLPVH